MHQVLLAYQLSENRTCEFRVIPKMQHGSRFVVLSRREPSRFRMLVGAIVVLTVGAKFHRCGYSRDRPLELSVRYARFQVQILILSELFEHEVCHIGTGNSSSEQPVSNVLTVSISASSRSVGKGCGTHDHPVQLGISNDSFLNLFVRKKTPQKERNQKVCVQR